MGVSRTSVRTALFRLEAEGLVAREGRGWIVPPIDLVEIEQLFASCRLAQGRRTLRARGMIVQQP